MVDSVTPPLARHIEQLSEVPLDRDPVADLIERLTSEGLISMADAAKLYGRKTHKSTPTRHALQGIRLPDGTVLKLESIRVSGALCTTKPAVLRFFAAQKSAHHRTDNAADHHTENSAARRRDRCEAGWCDLRRGARGRVTGANPTEGKGRERTCRTPARRLRESRRRHAPAGLRGLARRTGRPRGSGAGGVHSHADCPGPGGSAAAAGWRKVVMGGKAQVSRSRCRTTGARGASSQGAQLAARGQIGRWEREALDPIIRARPKNDPDLNYFVPHVWFRRGFAESLWCSANEFMMHARVLFARNPLTEVRWDGHLPAECHPHLTWDQRYPGWCAQWCNSGKWTPISGFELDGNYVPTQIFNLLSGGVEVEAESSGDEHLMLYQTPEDAKSARCAAALLAYGRIERDRLWARTGTPAA